MSLSDGVYVAGESSDEWLSSDISAEDLGVGEDLDERPSAGKSEYGEK